MEDEEEVPLHHRECRAKQLQGHLLKISKCTIANVPPQGGHKHPHQELARPVLPTKHVLGMRRRLRWSREVIGRRVGSRTGAKEETEQTSHHLKT